jgi:hypothetical protein
LKKLLLIATLVVAMELLATACDSLPIAALNSATATPSRTPRPTFTPRPAATETATNTDTPEATETAVQTETAVVQEPDTPTPRPIAKATRKPAPPPATPQPTTPTFAVHPDFGQAQFCQQDGIYEIMIYIKMDGSAGKRPFAGGLYYGVFSGGQLLKDGAGKDLIGTTDPIGSISFGSNCNASYDRLHPNQSNGKLDVIDVVNRGTKVMALRFIRSPSDLTAMSADVNIDFTQAGRWWTAFGYSGG